MRTSQNHSNASLRTEQSLVEKTSSFKSIFKFQSFANKTQSFKMNPATPYITPNWIRSNAELLAHVINATFTIAQNQNIYVPQMTPDGYCVMRSGEIIEPIYESLLIEGPRLGNPDLSIDEVDMDSLSVNVGSNNSVDLNVHYASLEQLSDEEIIRAAEELTQFMNQCPDSPRQLDEVLQVNEVSNTNEFEADLERPQGEGCDVPTCSLNNNEAPSSENHEQNNEVPNNSPRDVTRWYVLPSASPPLPREPQPFLVQEEEVSTATNEVSTSQQEEVQIPLLTEEPYEIYAIPSSPRPISYDSPPSPRPFIIDVPPQAPYYYSDLEARRTPSPSPPTTWQTEPCQMHENQDTAHASSCLWNCWRQAANPEETCDSIEYHRA